jgi:hypothetical protein
MSGSIFLTIRAKESKAILRRIQSAHNQGAQSFLVGKNWDGVVRSFLISKLDTEQWLLAGEEARWANPTTQTGGALSIYESTLTFRPLDHIA